MTKAEFLEKLRIELSSGVTPQVLQENLNYYGQYIDDEIRKGRTESEVLAELGDPWILAKTIVDAQREESVEDVIYDSDGRTYRGNSSTEESSNIHVWSLDSWWKRLLLILVAVAVIVVIFAVISGDCKPDRTGTDSSSGDHTAGQNAEKAMVIKKAGCIRFFCNEKKLMPPAF